MTDGNDVLQMVQGLYADSRWLDIVKAAVEKAIAQGSPLAIVPIDIGVSPGFEPSFVIAGDIYYFRRGNFLFMATGLPNAEDRAWIEKMSRDDPGAGPNKETGSPNKETGKGERQV